MQTHQRLPSPAALLGTIFSADSADLTQAGRAGSNQDTAFTHDATRGFETTPGTGADDEDVSEDEGEADDDRLGAVNGRLRRDSMRPERAQRCPETRLLYKVGSIARIEPVTKPLIALRPDIEQPLNAENKELDLAKLEMVIELLPVQISPDRLPSCVSLTGRAAICVRTLPSGRLAFFTGHGSARSISRPYSHSIINGRRGWQPHQVVDSLKRFTARATK
jgi:hypothetical protein